MIITIRLAALRLACAELRKFVTTRAQPAGLSHGGYEAGYVPATMPAGTVAGHAGWQPACTRTEVGPEHRLPRPDTGGTR